ncbi:MAG: hypothetical protein WAT77_08265 [Paracoccaceae bacterium]
MACSLLLPVARLTVRAGRGPVQQEAGGPTLIQINDGLPDEAQGQVGRPAPPGMDHIMMQITRRATLALAAGFAALVSVQAAVAAETTVTVSLWDKGAESVMMDDAHMAMMGKMQMPDTMAMMGITIDVATVPAGTVTFNVTNASKDIVHEMVLSPVTAGSTELPYLKDENRIDEETAGHLGEVSELDPGAAGSLTVDMTPGQYILYCNIPGHFIGGMWTLLTVTE